MHIALMGTRGVPPQYGGFETAVDEIGSRLVGAGHRVTVYCRNPGQTLKKYKGMELVNLPALRARATETLSHTALSAVHALFRGRPEVAFLFNAANVPFVPILRGGGIPVAVHLDGLESDRGKWSGLGARYYSAAEAWSVRWADAVIADARAIADHVDEQYGKASRFIPYGAPLVSPGWARVVELGLTPRGYHLVVARFEPENHVDMIVQGYVQSDAKAPLIVVGAAPYNDDYTRRVRHAADDRVRFLGAVWDQELLDELYAWSTSYLHGHSVGGTNPSLLRAMGAGAAVLAFDVVFNREVTDDHALFFTDSDAVARLVEQVEADPAKAEARGEDGRCHVSTAYRWDDVATKYERLAEELSAGAGRRPQE